MNYRHAYHAGNFADVVKHALLTRLIAYLKRKEKPFRVFDTHAGRGSYSLTSDEAQRTGEHADGVGRLVQATADVMDDPLLAEYREALASDLSEDRYPGSPLIARRLLRPQDRLSAYELHPADAAALKTLFAGDVQSKAIALDGWLALGSHVPPKEKRGLVLIDPPFERTDEVDAIAEGLAKALQRWAGGIYAVWYPLKRPALVAALHERLDALPVGERVTAEFFREPYSADERFVGTGLTVINPPFVFAAEAEKVLTTLAPLLGSGDAATFSVFTSSSPRP
jgi:23S rRNA (adenine2030-N6)-methyltransferase